MARVREEEAMNLGEGRNGGRCGRVEGRKRKGEICNYILIIYFKPSNYEKE